MDIATQAIADWKKYPELEEIFPDGVSAYADYLRNDYYSQIDRHKSAGLSETDAIKRVIDESPEVHRAYIKIHNMKKRNKLNRKGRSLKALW